MKNRFTILSQLWMPFLHTGIPTYAASSCYFFLISLLPSSLLLSSFLPRIPLFDSLWRYLASELLPSSLHLPFSAFYKYVSTYNSAAIISFSALSLLWSASKSVISLIDGLNAAIGITLRQSYLKKRIVAVAYFLLLSMCLFISLFALIFAGLLIKTITAIMPGIHPVIKSIFHFRGILSFLLLSAVFCLSYRYLPSQKSSWKSCALSASLVCACWLVLSEFFSLYVSLSSNHQKFDFLGVIILGTIWLRTCIMLFLYGGLLSKLISRSQYRPIYIIRSFFDVKYEN